VAETVTITDNRTGDSIEVPITNGGVDAREWSKLLPGVWFYDPAFSTTAAATSAITELDGEAGILRYRGYPIEQLAEHSTYLEVAYLLQRMESYRGLAILTTNMRGNIDDAFLRRLDGVIEFPLPGEAERLTIWQCSLPADAPRAADVDLGFLARKYKLAGGNIRNIAVAAAFLAAAEGGPITMRHFIGAVRREYQKLGKLVAEGDFEQYYGLLTASVVETPVNGQSSRLGSVK